MTAWKSSDWLGNVWESETGAGKFEITGAAYFWDRPVCWIDGETIAYWGIGEDDEEMRDAVVIYNLPERLTVKTIDGVPRGGLFFDQVLYCVSKPFGLSVWDIETNALIFEDKQVKPTAIYKIDDVFLAEAAKNSLRLNSFVSTGEKRRESKA